MMKYLLIIFSLISIYLCAIPDLKSVINELESNYQFSNYPAVDFTSAWWRTNNSTHIEFALLGRTGPDGWVSVGLLKFNTSDVEGTIQVLGKNKNNEIDHDVTGVYLIEGDVFKPTQVNGLAVTNSTIVETSQMNFTLVYFVWDSSETNPHFNFTNTSDVSWNFIIGFDNELKIHANQTWNNHANIGTGEFRSPFVACNSFTNCPNSNGVCVDQFLCQCKDGFVGPRCQTPIPPPPPPPPGPTPPPMNFEHKFEYPGMTGVTLYWNVSKDETLSIAVQAVGHQGYVGFGINNYTGMIGADAVIGWVDDNGKEHIGTYNLFSKRPPTQIVPIPTIYNISNSRVYYYNGTTTIMFERKFATGQHPISSNQTIILAAIGKTPAPNVTHHQHRVEPCCPSVNFQSGEIETAFPYQLVHGILQTIAWGFLLPIGALCARFLKHKKDALWFKIHRVTQPLGFLFCLCGFVIIVIYTVRMKSTHFAPGHPLGGIILFVGICVQVLSSLVRPEANKKNALRRGWEFFHHWLGRLLVIGSWVLMTFGLCKFAGGPMPECISNKTYMPYFIALFVWFGLLLIAYIILEVQKISRDRTKKYIQVK